MQNYLIIADNLGLRPIAATDIDLMAQLDCDPEVRSFFPGGIITMQQLEDKIKKNITDFARRGYGVFLIFDLESGEFIGRAGFGDLDSDVEVGYLLLKKYWGQGYATRILKILLAWARENIKAERIIAVTPLDHIASERVMQKAGMVVAGRNNLKGAECVLYEYRF